MNANRAVVNHPPSIPTIPGGPSGDHDEIDSAGIGHAFQAGEVVFDPSNGCRWVCLDPTPRHADWRKE